MIEVVSMAGFATIQDFGRPAYRSHGVPVGGAMDRRSLAAANDLVRNPRDAAGIEWALAGGSLQFSSRARIAAAGADAIVTLNGSQLAINTAADVEAGDALRVERILGGAFLYVAVRGGIDVPTVLGSRATYTPAGFGGLEGRRLRTGDRLAIGRCAVLARSHRVVHAHPTMSTRGDHAPIRVTEGPDSLAFSPEFRDEFWACDFAVSPSSNRVGYRLERRSTTAEVFAAGISEPACVGAIQVPSAGGAIVIMPDGPTVGGYPKIGVVASADIGLLAQRQPGSTVRFERISLAAAHELLRTEPALADGDVRT